MNKELYKAKVKDFCNLMNVSDLSTKPTAQAIYDKINGRFTDDDMVRSFDEMMEAEVIKLTYPILMRYLKKYKDIRVTAQLQRDKLKIHHETEVALSRPEIQELIHTVIEKKGWKADGHDYLSARDTVVMPDGRVLPVWVDWTDPNLQPGRAITIVHVQRGDQMVRTQRVNFRIVRHKILTKRNYPGAVQSMFAPPPPTDDDFIPELEVTDDAIQDSLGLDGPAGGHA